MARSYTTLNRETPHLSDLVSAKYQVLVVFCSSHHCAPGSGLKNGAFIDAGQHVRQINKCPMCGSKALKFQRMSEGWVQDKLDTRARKLKRLG